ncbi:MAG: Lrp/AsnC ligand binding domain-containing protein [Bacteroidia bacterium]|nr:Lrp/AsnC ligand binding domain-containing protein [Bacteroidia bacterium]
MDRKHHIDILDKEIIELLVLNARESYLEIAKKLKISNSLVHQRIRKMKDVGLIKGSYLELDPKILGYHTFAYTGISLKEGRFTKSVANSLKKIKEVVEYNFVTGKYAIFVKLYAKNNEHLQKVLYEQIHYIEGVSSTDTFIAFESFSRHVSIPPYSIH